MSKLTMSLLQFAILVAHVTSHTQTCCGAYEKNDIHNTNDNDF
ncbi:hypothetical protein [uncultured Aquimarina sp.]|nr:hypothetical protein [uncultured Aquimarina sp.]